MNASPWPGYPVEYYIDLFFTYVHGSNFFILPSFEIGVLW